MICVITIFFVFLKLSSAKTSENCINNRLQMEDFDLKSILNKDFKNFTAIIQSQEQ